MLKRKHSKLCLRRMSSRSTLISQDRHSKVCIRNRGRRLGNRLHSIFTILRKRSERQDYFTGRLPAEIRLLIYRYAMCFDTPISLDRNPKRGPKSKMARILLVNRLIYAEALPILHELNEIVISREEFCHFPTGKRPQLTIKPELVERLYIRDLAASNRCTARQVSPWPRRPCSNCSDSLLGLVNTLRLKPRLKEVYIDYHGHHHAIRALLNGILYYPPEIQVFCTGIGRYRLAGDILRGVKFKLLDVPLVMVWSRMMKLPVRYPYATNYRANRLVWRDLKALEQRMELSDLAVWIVKITGLIQNHDAHFIPANFADIWPADIPMNFRTVEVLGSPELLHDMNVQLQAFLETGPLVLQDLVVRRG